LRISDHKKKPGREIKGMGESQTAVPGIDGHLFENLGGEEKPGGGNAGVWELTGEREAGFRFKGCQRGIENGAGGGGKTGETGGGFRTVGKLYTRQYRIFGA